MQDEAGDVDLRDEEGEIRPEFLHAVVAALDTGEAAKLRDLALPLHEADLADLIELLRPEQRTMLIATLGEDFDAATLPELDEAVRDQVLETMPSEQVAEALQQLDSDDAVYVIEDLDKEEQTDILAKLPHFERLALERSRAYKEDSAGRIMQTDLIAVPPFWSVGQTIDYMREAEDLPDRFYELFVVDPAYHLLGSVALNSLLRAKRPTSIDAVTERDIHPIPVEADQEAVARQFERYNLTSAPVVDGGGRLVGVITADDIVEVVQEEASEDILRMGGVAGERVSDSVWRTASHRFTWLFANLLTAILASFVISLFEAK
ncbi:MAG: CBS domain-containing protein, partial [Mesorhizobium sp.]